MSAKKPQHCPFAINPKPAPPNPPPPPKQVARWQWPPDHMHAVLHMIGRALDEAWDPCLDDSPMMPHYACTQRLNQLHSCLTAPQIDIDTVCLVLGLPR